MSDDNTFLHIDKREIDLEALDKFKKEHAHKDVYFGAIGGHLEYIIVPTTIGLMCSIKCSHCNEEQSITNYDIF